MGFLEPDKIVIPGYPQDWHIHNNEELLLNSLREQNYLQEVSSPVEIGDILVFKYGKASSHVGIYVNNTIYHSINNRTVIRTPFRDPTFRKRMTAIFRCMDEEVIE